MSVDKTRRTDAWPEQETVGPSKTAIILRQFLSTTFQNFRGISDLLPEASKFQHHTKPCSKSNILLLEHGFVWCRKLDASGSRSEVPGKLLNVVLKYCLKL
jgi:hypothetical protein